jgi:hypothetical protein
MKNPTENHPEPPNEERNRVKTLFMIAFMKKTDTPKREVYLSCETVV